MNAPCKLVANLYEYDPLNRLISAHSAQRFYNSSRIATEMRGDRKTFFFEYEAMPLAELHSNDAATLLATDQKASVLHSICSTLNQPQTYSPYGHRPKMSGLLSVLGFNGERPDELTGHYLLGQGYRAFNPVLMRFNSPDSLSPFGNGGINAYAYCAGDPMNRVDPSGHNWFASLLKKVMKVPPSASAATASYNTKKVTKSLTKRFNELPTNLKNNSDNLSELELANIIFYKTHRNKNKRVKRLQNILTKALNNPNEKDKSAYLDVLTPTIEKNQNAAQSIKEHYKSYLDSNNYKDTFEDLLRNIDLGTLNSATSSSSSTTPSSIAKNIRDKT